MKAAFHETCLIVKKYPHWYRHPDIVDTINYRYRCRCRCGVGIATGCPFRLVGES